MLCRSSFWSCCVRGVRTILGGRRFGLTFPAEFEPLQARSPERQILQGQTAEAVARAVTQLPGGQPEALILAHYEQMPLAKIAKSRLQRARAQLKETLAVYARGSEKKR